MGSQIESFVFDDLEPRKIPVRIKGKDYVLWEASADAATKYRNAAIKSMKVKNGRASGFDGLADAEPLLVGMCLKEVGSGKAVGSEFVRGLLNRQQKQLYQWCKENSDLIDKSENKDDPLAKAVLTALARQDLPFSQEEFAAWVKTQADLDEVLEPLADLLSKPGDAAKNAPGATSVNFE